MPRGRIVLVLAICAAMSSVSCRGGSKDLYPLIPGEVREYQLSSASMLGGPQALRMVITNMPHRELQGRDVAVQKIEAGEQTAFRFISADQSGIAEVAWQRPGAIEPQILSSTNYMLMLPIEKGASWDSSPTMLLISENVPRTALTTVESIQETVTVPLGTFQNCVRTLTSATTKKSFGFMGTATMNFEERSWYCPGAGLVKIVREQKSNHLMTGSSRFSMELASLKTS